MFAHWFFYTLIGCLTLHVIHGEDIDYDSEEIPDYQVAMSVDLKPKSIVTSPVETVTTTVIPPTVTDSTLFSCFECTDCQTKSEKNIQVCPSGIRSCYTVKKRLQNKNQVIRRGCSATANHCSVPGDGDLSMESVTCCEQDQCNRAMFQQPSLLILFIFLLVSLMMMMSNDI